MKEKEIIECHICTNTEEESEIYICERCNNYFCDECSSSYDIFSQIDYSCCERCANTPDFE